MVDAAETTSAQANAEADAKRIEEETANQRQLVKARRHRRRAVRQRIAQAVFGASHEATRAVAAFGGATLIGYGAWLAYAPAGFVVSGTLLIAGLWLHDRNG